MEIWRYGDREIKKYMNTELLMQEFLNEILKTKPNFEKMGYTTQNLIYTRWLEDRLQQAEKEKTEAVRIAIERIKTCCDLCSNFGCDPLVNYYSKDCSELTEDISKIESLTGKPWSEVIK